MKKVFVVPVVNEETKRFDGLAYFGVRDDKIIWIANEYADEEDVCELKPGQLIDQVLDCAISWGRKYVSLEEFMKLIVNAIGLIKIIYDPQELALARLFYDLNAEFYKSELKKYFKEIDEYEFVPLIEGCFGKLPDF